MSIIKVKKAKLKDRSLEVNLEETITTTRGGSVTNEIIKKCNTLVHDDLIAAFVIDDLTLDPKAGSCNSCPKNTSSNLILFPDSPSTGVCLDRVCFKKKSDVHFDRELKRIQEQEPDILFGYRSYISGQAEKDVKELIKNGVSGIELGYSSGFYDINEPEKPEAPDESEYDDPDEYNEAIEEFKGELLEYEEELKEYNEKLESGNLRKVFILGGEGRGKFLMCEQRNNKSDAQTNNSNSAEARAALQILELRAKDKRNQELTFEKLYFAAKELLNESGYSGTTEPLTDNEMIASFVVMLGFGSSDINKEIFNDSTSYYVENRLKLPAAIRLTDDQKAKVMRSWLKRHLDTSSPNFQISESKALIEIAREKYPDQLTQVELELQGKYLKRKEKIDQLITDLKSKNE